MKKQLILRFTKIKDVLDFFIESDTSKKGLFVFVPKTTILVGQKTYLEIGERVT